MSNQKNSKTKKATNKASTTKKKRPKKVKKNRVVAITLSSVLGGLLLVFGVLYFTLWFNKGPKINELRYEVVPSTEALRYNEKNALSSFSESNLTPDRLKEDGVIVYSVQGEKTNYYLLYLGYVNNAPVSTSSSIRYDGGTSIAFSLSKSFVTTTSVTNSTTETVSNTVRNTTTLEASLALTVEAGINLEAISAKKSVTATMSASNAFEISKEKSISNTKETAISKSSEITETISFTIGDNREKNGYYRLAMFSTSDIYCYLEVDKETKELKKEVVTTCARPDTYAYMLDYDGGAGDFKKTSNSDTIQISETFIQALPTPTKTVDDKEVEPPIPVERKVVYDMTSIRVKHDTNYSFDVIETLTDNDPDPNGFQILINGCEETSNGHLKIHSTPEVYLKLLYHPNTWPSKNREKLFTVNNDSDTTIAGTGFYNSGQIGHGAYYVAIKFRNITGETYVKVADFMNGAVGGQVFNIFKDIDLTGKELEELWIVVAYEIRIKAGSYQDFRFQRSIIFDAKE